jgi:hypothetical protein
VCNDDEFQCYGKLYSLDYRTIENDLSLELNTLAMFKPHGKNIVLVIPWKEHLNSDGQQFHQIDQSPLTFIHWTQYENQTLIELQHIVLYKYFFRQYI